MDLLKDIREIELDQEDEMRDILDITEGAFTRYINQFVVLTPEEEIECATKIKEGDKKERERLINCNLRLVKGIASFYDNRGMQFNDLIQEGIIGLILAVDRFDVSKGYKFSTYATVYIRSFMSRAIMKCTRTAGLPSKAGERYNKIMRTKIRLTNEFGREPTPEEIAKELGMSVKDVNKLIIGGSFPYSLDGPIYDDNKKLMHEIIKCSDELSLEELAFRNTLKDEIEDLLSYFSARDNKIINMLFGLDGNKPKTLEETGKILGNRTKEAIRLRKVKFIKQVKKRGLRKKIEETDELNPYGGKIFNKYIERKEDTISGLILEISKQLPRVDKKFFTVFFDKIGVLDGIRKSNDELRKKYNYSIETIDQIIKLVSREISKNEKTKHIYFAILRRGSIPLEESTQQRKNKKPREVKPIKKIKKTIIKDPRLDYQELFDESIAPFKTSIIKRIISIKMFGRTKTIAEKLIRNYNSTVPKTLTDFAAENNYSVDEVLDTIAICFELYFKDSLNYMVGRDNNVSEPLLLKTYVKIRDRKNETKENK